jgi:5-methyltetrahydrofolate--homocysteine methyltransferase
MSDLLSRLLAERPWLMGDGATGTNLFAAGLQTGDAPELWNLEEPEKIMDLHRGFIAAGSDIILTNSFGGTANRLKLHDAQGRVREINKRAAELAAAAAAEVDRPIVVAGSMGPTGDLYEPLGPLTIESGAEAYREQAQALAEGGADVLWIETISSTEEMTAAVTGAKSADLPMVCTLSFDTNGRTMMGLTPADLGRLAEELDPHPFGVGGNCGTGPAELLAALVRLQQAAKPGTILVAKSNCGIPEYVDGKIRYNGTPKLMADYARLALDAGARIVGGCCGTTPEHLEAMRAAMESHEIGSPPSVDEIIARLGDVSRGGQSDESPGGGRRGRGGRRRAREQATESAD